MSVSNPGKTVTPGSIPCDGTATVTLQFDAAANLSSDPADIILMMDRSCSMAAPRMDYAKAAAKQFIGVISNASGSSDTAMSRVGIVSFADDAHVDMALTDQTAALYNAIDSLNPNGSTNHEAAFLAAEGALPFKGRNRQIAVIFTDGVTTKGGDANAVAQRMKATGVEIYCIGLGQNRTQIDTWASTPVSTHVTSDADPEKLGQLFRQIAAEVISAGAYDAKIVETIHPDFKITNIGIPTVGTVTAADAHTIIWTIGTVGLSKEPRKVLLSFQITHTAATGGLKPVNASIVYSDRGGNQLQFPDPKLDVQCQGGGCGIEILPEPCPAPTVFTVQGCEDAVHVEIQNVSLTGLGRIVQADATVQHVCPGKRVAVSILLEEIAPDGTVFPRGAKHILIPAQTGNRCRNITLRCIPFSLPEALDVSGNPDAICNPRHFNARIIANYVDTDFSCCEARTSMTD